MGSGRASRARRSQLGEGSACGMRLPWTVWRGGMMQGGWGAHGLPRGTSAPSSGARGGRPLFAAFARFGALATEKNAICRVP